MKWGEKETNLEKVSSLKTTCSALYSSQWMRLSEFKHLPRPRASRSPLCLLSLEANVTNKVHVFVWEVSPAPPSIHCIVETEI